VKTLLHRADLNWRQHLMAAVSPFESGVEPLEVSGYRPVGADAYRPTKTAAVLVALMDTDEPEVVLTRRADHLDQHAGQVSFPGGAAEEHDDSAVQTALREAYEEIGLPPEQTRPIGFLDRMDTISDYRVLPVVALVSCPVTWQLDLSEVAEVFTVPLTVVLDRNRYVRRKVEHNGREHYIWSLQWGKHNVWGATAAMLLNLVSRVERVRAS
jgi:8-oxo-dGTP pyrophosphatase MutT (NUDIX family)